MSDGINRPENYQLDDEQNYKLFNFLQSQPKEKLEDELKKLDQMSLEDNKFGGGSLPANLNKTRNFIRSLLNL